MSSETRWSRDSRRSPLDKAPRRRPAWAEWRRGTAAFPHIHLGRQEQWRWLGGSDRLRGEAGEGGQVRLTGSSRGPKVLQTHWPLTNWNTMFLTAPSPHDPGKHEPVSVGGREGERGGGGQMLIRLILYQHLPPALT